MLQEPIITARRIPMWGRRCRVHETHEDWRAWKRLAPDLLEPKSLEPKMATELCFHVISCSWFSFAFGLVFLEGPCSLVGAPLLLLVFWFGFQLLNLSKCLCGGMGMLPGGRGRSRNADFENFAVQTAA